MLDDERKGAREKNKPNKKNPTKEQEDGMEVLGMIHKRHPT